MNSGRMVVRSFEPFHRTAKGLLSAEDIEAIEWVLGNDPFAGEALDGSDGTFVFVYKNAEVHYGIFQSLDVVVLLIAKPKGSSQKINPKKINSKLVDTGKKWLGREIYYRIREWIRDNLPEDWDPTNWF